MEKRTCIMPLWELKELWVYLNRVPVVEIEETFSALRNPARIEDVGTIKHEWHTFPKGTHVTEIYEWMTCMNSGFHPTLYSDPTMREYSNVTCVPWILPTDVLDQLLMFAEERAYFVVNAGRTRVEQMWQVMFNDGATMDTQRQVVVCHGDAAMGIATALAERLNVHYRWQKLLRRLRQTVVCE